MGSAVFLVSTVLYVLTFMALPLSGARVALFITGLFVGLLVYTGELFVDYYEDKSMNFKSYRPMALAMQWIFGVWLLGDLVALHR